MVAYACNPEAWGEHWLGWKWAEEAAKWYSVTLVTRSANQRAINPRAASLDLTPVYVDVPHSRLARNENVIHQILWQRAVWPVVQRLHAEHPFQLVHQTTFHSFRVPFYASRLPIPSLWGPIAGGESCPRGFGRFLGPRRRAEALRQLANRPWLYLPPVYQSLKRATALWVSNRVTLLFLPQHFRQKASVVPANAARPEDLEAPDCHEPLIGQPLSLLYAGNCVATRSIPLVLAALKQARLHPRWNLCIAGDGPAIPHWKEEIRRHALQTHVDFLGHVPRAELEQYHRRCHAVVFPGLRDSGGSAMIEGMSKGLPVVYLDWGGPAEMADCYSGIPIPVRHPEETIDTLARCFERLECDHEWRRTLGANARARVIQHFGWDTKARLLRQTYDCLLSEH